MIGLIYPQNSKFMDGAAQSGRQSCLTGYIAARVDLCQLDGVVIWEMQGSLITK
jgi:hypothetical protein